MARRYEVLDRIPDKLADIDSQIQKANGFRAGSPEREGLILGAAATAYATIVDLTDAALLWMALQRQVLVKGWRFQDLEQLDQLTVPATVDLLVALRVGRKQQAERLLREAMADERAPAKDFIGAACAKLDEVKRAAAQAAAADGLTAPSAELLLVDHAHTEAMKVRRDLNALITAWKAEQDHETDVQTREARLQRILKRCGQAVGVIAFVTAAALQIPEVQRYVVDVASGLAQIIEHTAGAIRVQISALGVIGGQIGSLGVVAATSIASKPGEGFSLFDPEPSPNDPSPSRDPSSVIASVNAMPRSDPPAAQAQPTATRSPDDSLGLPHQDDPSDEPDVEIDLVDPGDSDLLPSQDIARELGLVDPVDSDPQPSQDIARELDEIVDGSGGRPAAGSAGTISP